MLQIVSLNALMDVWTELEAAYYGYNGYGGDTAEIYGMRIRPLSAMAREGIKRDAGSFAREAVIEEGNEIAQALLAILNEFQKRHKCKIRVDDVSPKKALSTPLVHRVHVQVIPKDKSVQRVR